MTNTTPLFCGPLAAALTAFMELMRTIGGSHVSLVSTLRRLDRYLAQQHPTATTLTQSIVIDWCATFSHLRPASQCRYPVRDLEILRVPSCARSGHRVGTGSLTAPALTRPLPAVHLVERANRRPVDARAGAPRVGPQSPARREPLSHARAPLHGGPAHRGGRSTRRGRR